MAEALGQAAWSAGLGLLGVPFRLHGRDPASGLDCVGLVAAAYAAAGYAPALLPDRYRLRGEDAASVLRWLTDAGLVAAHGAVQPGDVALSAMGFGQLHLMLLAPDGALHAHAGLGRVVLTPGAPPGRVTGRWRVLASLLDQ